MSKFEKFMNILMNILGISFIFVALCIWEGYITPKPFAVGLTYILVAIFFLLGKYSKPKSE